MCVLHRDWLSVEQKRDSEIRNLIAKHSDNTFLNSVASTYDVREGILYRKINRNKAVSWLPVVPRSLIWTLINHIHNEVQHLDKAKILDKLYEQYLVSRNVKMCMQVYRIVYYFQSIKRPFGSPTGSTSSNTYRLHRKV